jgi:hypothetical protein
MQHDPDGRPVPTHYLVLEYCDGGDLAEFLDSRKRSGSRGIDEATARRLLRMLAMALREMHSRNIVHVRPPCWTEWSVITVLACHTHHVDAAVCLSGECSLAAETVSCDAMGVSLSGHRGLTAARRLRHVLRGLPSHNEHDTMDSIDRRVQDYLLGWNSYHLLITISPSQVCCTFV